MLTTMTNENDIAVDVCAFALPREYCDARRASDPAWKAPANRLLTDMDLRLVANPPMSQEIIACPGAAAAPTVAEADAANAGLKRMVSDDPEMFQGAIAAAPLKDIAQAVHVLRADVAASDLLLGVGLPAVFEGTPISDERFEPLFAAAEQVQRPVWLLAGKNATNSDAAGEGGNAAAKVLAGLVSSGCFQRHPRLLLIVHGALADGPTATAAALAPLGDSLPAGLFLDTAGADAGAIEGAAGVFGAARLLFGTGLPADGVAHESDGPDCDEAVLALARLDAAGLSEGDRHAVRCGNWEALVSCLPIDMPKTRLVDEDEAGDSGSDETGGAGD